MLTTAKLADAGSIARLAWRSPAEFVDRLRGQVELRRERHRERDNFGYAAGYVDGTHKLLGAVEPCTICAGFGSIWSAIQGALVGSGHTAGKGYDGGVALANIAYSVARHMRPGVVVETGVARGITSRVILEALEENDKGHLYSIDLPPLTQDWSNQVAAAVTEDLRRRWTYIRGSSRRLLPNLLKTLGSVPMFVHDSLHTYANMTREMNTAWEFLQPGGILLCDDVEDNKAFSDFTRSLPAESRFVAQEPFRTGFVGGIRKPFSLPSAHYDRSR